MRVPSLSINRLCIAPPAVRERPRGGVQADTSYAREHYQHAFESPTARRVLLQLERLYGFEEIMNEIEGGVSRLDGVAPQSQMPNLFPRSRPASRVPRSGDPH